MKALQGIVIGASLFMATPALADEPYAVTPSGATEAYFAMPTNETSDYLAGKCFDLGWTMVSSTETVVVCEVPVSFGTKLLAALAGPRYATPPRQYFRFNLAGVRGNTRVQASAWQETQTAFGQTQRTDMETSNYHNSVMTFFEGVGGIYPPGTQFPNHALAGFRYEEVEEPEKGLKIIEVSPGGAFEQAGLREGDIVLRIAGERTKGSGDLLDSLHRAVAADTYEVQFARHGKKDKVAVPRLYRATADQELPERVAATEAASSTTVVAPMSMADELLKFAELREQGIITDEEFEAQKAKLLAGQ